MRPFGAQWLARFGFRLARLATYARTEQSASSEEVQSQIQPITCWARADAISLADDLQYALNDSDVTSAANFPTLRLGQAADGTSVDDISSIDDVITWVAEWLADAGGAYLGLVFGVAVQSHPVFDRYIGASVDTTKHRADVVQVGRAILRDISAYMRAVPPAAADVVDLLRERFRIDVSTETDVELVCERLDNVPEELLVTEFFDGVAGLLDRFVSPPSFRRDPVARNIVLAREVDLLGLRTQLLNMWRNKRPAVLSLVGDAPAVMIAPKQVFDSLQWDKELEVPVFAREGFVEVYVVRRWSDLLGATGTTAPEKGDDAASTDE